MWIFIRASCLLTFRSGAAPIRQGGVGAPVAGWVGTHGAQDQFWHLWVLSVNINISEYYLYTLTPESLICQCRHMSRTCTLWHQRVSYLSMSTHESYLYTLTPESLICQYRHMSRTCTLWHLRVLFGNVDTWVVPVHSDTWESYFLMSTHESYLNTLTPENLCQCRHMCRKCTLWHLRVLFINLDTWVIPVHFDTCESYLSMLTYESYM